MQHWIVSFTPSRVIQPELLDTAGETDARKSLEDLVRLNRYFGGYRILRHILRQFVGPADNFTLLDVGAATGDMGRAVRRHFSNARVTSLDARLLHLAGGAGPRVAGDAFRLPFRPASFDFVFSSLFLHHFDHAGIVQLLTGFRIVAGRAVIAEDLERGPFAFRFLGLTRPVFRWHPLTMHDGPISVQAAFQRDELLALAREAGLSEARVRRHPPWARLSLIAPLDIG